jgi:hypothetical protein
MPAPGRSATSSTNRFLSLADQTRLVRHFRGMFMKVRMATMLSGTAFRAEKGDVLDLPKDEAERLVRAGAASYLQGLADFDDADVEEDSEDDEVNSIVESAAKGDGVPRKRGRPRSKATTEPAENAAAE